MPGLISEAEREELYRSALAQRLGGALRPNPAGPGRFFRKLDDTGGVDELVEALTARLEARVRGLAGGTRDRTLGRVCSLIEPGGFIHEHTDKYPAGWGRGDGWAHLRANIVVRMADPSGRPMIEGQALLLSLLS